MKTAGWTALLLTGATGAMAQESVQLDPIIVESAARDSRSILDTPVSVTVREGDALEERQATNFQELIGDVPGLTIEGGPRAIAQEPNIRGFQDEQIVLRFDGGRFNFNQAHRGRFFIDPDIVQRVEVIRGGGSTLYGSGALGGVISVQTKDVDDLLEPGDGFGARLLGGYASNGEIGRATATVYGRQGRFDALGFLGWQPQGTSLEDGNGDTIRSSDVDVINGLLKLGFEPNDANRLEFNGSLYRDEGTVPPNANTLGSPETDVDRDADVATASLGWDFAPEGSALWDLSVLAYYTGLEITEDRDRDGRADKTQYRTYGIDITNRSSFDTGVPWTLVYGFEALRDTQEGQRNGQRRAQFPDAKATTIAAFAEATIAVTDRLEITPGLRYDRYERDPDAVDLADVTDDFWSPRLGISYRPTENWQIFGNVARAFRAPSLVELYNDDVHFATPGFPLGRGVFFSGVNEFVPNPDLEPETSTQFEIGTRYIANSVFRGGDALSLNANAYYADVDDFIDQRVNFIDFSTASFGPRGVVVGGTTTSTNVDARLWGFEAAADYDAGTWFGGLGLTIPRGEADGGGALGSIPQDRLSVTLGIRPAPDLELGGRVIFASDQDDVPEDTPEGEAFTVLDLFASWSPSFGRFEDVVFRAGIDNVFNETYAIYPNEVNQPGRTFKISAAVTF
ncbi:MAG: TonB-dependent hemoglobin/transferrin/lactoferrin family receptor [Pseudomonadota bacterium]